MGNELKPFMEPGEISANIEALQRTPFKNLLADYLECAPDKESIQEFANTYPDRYAKAIKDLGALSGYQDTVSHEHNYLIAIGKMPDSAIDVRMKELEKQLNDSVGISKISKQMAPVVIEGEVGESDQQRDEEVVPEQGGGD